jgi:hypothetical protein
MMTTYLQGVELHLLLPPSWLILIFVAGEGAVLLEPETTEGEKPMYRL